MWKTKLSYSYSGGKRLGGCDCFLYVTGAVREIVYFLASVQETSLLMHVPVALEEAKEWIYFVGVFLSFVFLLRHRESRD